MPMGIQRLADPLIYGNMDSLKPSGLGEIKKEKKKNLDAHGHPEIDRPLGLWEYGCSKTFWAWKLTFG